MCTADIEELQIAPVACVGGNSGFILQEDPLPPIACPDQLPELTDPSGFLTIAFAPPGTLGIEGEIPLLVCLNVDKDGDAESGLQSGPEQGTDTSLCISTDGGEMVVSHFGPDGEFTDQELLSTDEVIRIAESVVTFAVPDLGISEAERAASAVLVSACEINSSTGALSCDRAGWSCLYVEPDEMNPAMLPDCRTSKDP